MPCAKPAHFRMWGDHTGIQFIVRFWLLIFNGNAVLWPILLWRSCCVFELNVSLWLWQQSLVIVYLAAIVRASSTKPFAQMKPRIMIPIFLLLIWIIHFLSYTPIDSTLWLIGCVAAERFQCTNRTKPDEWCRDSNIHTIYSTPHQPIPAHISPYDFIAATEIASRQKVRDRNALWI